MLHIYSKATEIMDTIIAQGMKVVHRYNIGGSFRGFSFTAGTTPESEEKQVISRAFQGLSGIQGWGRSQAMMAHEVQENPVSWGLARLSGAIPKSTRYEYPDSAG
jgi:hypothetical protein